MITENTTDFPIKVSVIMPVYNSQAYLRETLDSILAQSLKEFELICVDDGSTDDSLQILKEYQKKDDRIQVMHQQNQFAGAARNRGIEAATGEFLVFWDSDDIFEKTALEEMYQQCVKDEADICICGASEFEKDLTKRISSDTYLKERYLPEKVPFYHEDIDEYIFYFSTNVSWNKMLRKDLILEHQIRYQGYRHGEDTMFVMAALFFAGKFTLVKKPLVNYRVYNSNSLTGKMHERPLDVLHSYEDTYELLSKQEGFHRVEKSFFNKFIAGMINDLKHHATMTSYEAIFEEYRKKVIEWNLPDDRAYYLNETMYHRVVGLLQDSPQDFLLSEYKLQAKISSKFRGKSQMQAKRIERLRKKLQRREKNEEKLREKILSLEQQLAKVKEEKKQLEHSTSYQVGRKVTWIPRKIKSTMKKHHKK